MLDEKEVARAGLTAGPEPREGEDPGRGRPDWKPRAGRREVPARVQSMWRGWWWLLVMLPLAAMLATFAGAMLVPPSYTAQASLLVSFGREYVFRPLVGASETIMPWRPETIVNSELEILNSGDLSRQVVERIGLARMLGAAAPNGDADPREWEKALVAFRSGLALKGVKDSNIIHAQFRHSDPAVAADALRLLLDGYLQRRGEIYSTQSVTFLEQRVSEQERVAEAVGTEFQDYKRERGLLRWHDERAALREREGALLSEQDRLQKEHAEAKAEHAVLQPLGSTEATEIGRIEARISGAAAALAEVGRLLKEARARLDFIEGNRMAIERRGEQLALEQRRLEEARKHLDEARLGEALDQSRLTNVRIIESPRVPLLKDGLALRTRLAVAGLSGLFAAVGLFIMLARAPEATSGEIARALSRRTPRRGLARADRAAA